MMIRQGDDEYLYFGGKKQYLNVNANYASEEELVSRFVDESYKELAIHAVQITNCFKLFNPEVTREEIEKVIYQIRKENY